ncbi:MAG: hypothetical protein JRH07_01115, partial [Deltaproteobacteria bacterium]|nr:hypothetical protein [Deltaproteobacteria bacterium]
NIDILKIIDGLRELVMSGRVEYYNPYPEIPSMHRVFLKQVERHGRICEIRLASVMNLKTVDPFKDVDLLWPGLANKRIRLVPERSEGVKRLRDVVSRVREIEGES